MRVKALSANSCAAAAAAADVILHSAMALISLSPGSSAREKTHNIHCDSGWCVWGHVSTDDARMMNVDPLVYFYFGHFNNPELLINIHHYVTS